jgi:ABC-type dipeptide/oligopeptide/nickel transport system ATPase component
MLVLFAGRSIEHGAIADVYDSPSHPYTRALLDAVPDSRNLDRPLCLDGPRQATVAIFSYQAILTSTPGE